MELSAPSAAWLVPAIALAALASLFAIVQSVRLAWSRASRSWAAQARARKAVEGEMRAEPLLRDAGYEVLERQVRGSWVVLADGAPLEVGLRADLLVARGGRRYIAEVKTGRLAPRLDHAATRRQLLEYRMAFGVDGILLVDAEAERVIAVEIGDVFPRSEARPAALMSRLAPVLGVGIAVGVVLGWILRGR